MKSLRNVAVFFVLFLVLSACGGATGITTVTGPSSKLTTKVVGLTSENVTKIRITVTGSSIPTSKQDFNGSTGGTIEVYPGSNLIVSAQALDSNNAVLLEGAVSNVTVTELAATNVTVTLIRPVLKDADTNCLACHSDTKDITGQSVVAGYKLSGHYINKTWVSNSKYGVTGTGCAGCHGPKHNDANPSASGRCWECHGSAIEDNHQNNGTATTNCISCHEPHNPKSALPPVPTGLTATVVSSSQITLSWTDNATNEAGYKIERKVGVSGTYAQVSVTAANVTSFTDTGLTASTTYYYRVRTTNNSGDSSFATEAFITTSSSVLTDATTGMVLQKVAGGTFTMGDTFGDGYSDELPTHQVTLSDFYIGKYEVTQGQWVAVMGSNPSYFSACGLDCPVNSVSWNDIQTFITQLNQLSAKSYRLPTEAEWEYAARSGGQHEEYSGGSNVDAVAWYGNNSNLAPHQVGTKQANGLGLYDMSGNAWEWVNDWYGAYGSSSQTNPTGPTTGSDRVLRGGGWGGDASDARAAGRSYDSPGARSYNLGFRLASPAHRVGGYRPLDRTTS